MDYCGHDDHMLPGQRFVPMEDELLLCYLKPLVHGMQVPGRDLVVFDCDLYGDQEPWEIWELYKTRRENDLRKNKDLFFFTQQKKKTPKDSRVGRTVGRGGTWKEESSKAVTSPETNRVIGQKKTFGYKNQGSPHEGCWILLEFELDPSQLIRRQQETNYVICILRKKKDPENKRIKQREQMPEHNSVPDNRTNLISQEPEQPHLVPSTSNAPPPPLGSGAVKDEPQLCWEPPCINNPNAQTVPLPYDDFPGEDMGEVQKFEAGEPYFWQEMLVASAPHLTLTHHHRGRGTYDGVHYNYQLP